VPKTTAETAVIWFSPICNLVLARLQAWDAYYDSVHGYKLTLPIIRQKRSMYYNVKVEVISTRKFMEGTQVVDKPTAYIHSIPWTLIELDHLVRIVTTLRPKSTEEEIVLKMRDLWTNPNGTLLSGGYKVLALPFYQGAIKSLINILMEAKNGVVNRGIAQIKNQQSSKGKDLFEV